MNILFYMVFFCTFIFNQNHKQEYSPTVADYEDKLIHVEKMSKGVFARDTWTEIILKNKSTEKELPWNDLTDYQKDMFMFVVGNRTLNSILKIEEYWDEEIKKFDSPNFKLIPSNQSRPATKKEVVSYLEQLQKKRKIFVKDLEYYHKYFFEKYEKELTHEEIESFRKKVKDFQ